MKLWQKIAIGVAAYEVVAYAWNYAVPLGILPSTLPALPLDLIGSVFPQTVNESQT